LIRSAVRQSEESHIERAMLDDKIAATDWEATQDELIQQVARESYLQWLCDANQQHKDNKTVCNRIYIHTIVLQDCLDYNQDHVSRTYLP
jgi:hypothetical protein